MELGIDINNRIKQFAGIGRNHLSDFQDCIQYKFPYPVRNGQFEHIANDKIRIPIQMLCIAVRTTF